MASVFEVFFVVFFFDRKQKLPDVVCHFLSVDIAIAFSSCIVVSAVVLGLGSSFAAEMGRSSTAKDVSFSSIKNKIRRRTLFEKHKQAQAKKKTAEKKALKKIPKEQVV